MTEGSIVTDCWGELFYITPGLGLELGFDGPQGFPLSFHTELSVAIFLGTLAPFDLALLNQRFSVKTKHSYKDIQTAIIRGRLHVFPMDAPIALASSVLTQGRPNQSTAAQSQQKALQSPGFKTSSVGNNGLECVNRTQKVIRSDIRNTLQQIIQQERLESRQIERDYKRKSAFEKTGVHIQKFRKGLHQATTSFLTWVKDVNDVISINQRLLRTLMAVQVASHVETDNRYELFQKTLSILEKKEIVDVLGFDPSLVTTAQITEVYSLAKLVYDDHATRLIITHFAHDYIKAQHQLEWSEFSGGASFEIILTAFLAVVTGGVGAMASLGAQARKISQLKKLGELLSELAELLKKTPKNKKLTLRQQKAVEDKNERQIKPKDSSAQHEKPTNKDTAKDANVSVVTINAADIPKRNRPAPDNYQTYKTHGVDSPPMATPEGRAIVASYEAQGMERAEAISYADGVINSSSSLPKKVQLAKGDALYKLVPEGEMPGGHSAYFAKQSDVVALEGQSYDQISDQLGIPLESQQTQKFDIVKVEALEAIDVFEATIAPTSQNNYHQPGGGTQMLITNRKSFSAPIKTGLKLP